ncbi:MAG: YicC/YloC family endoribonuclease, partial [Thermoanaerobaculia bacterium]|nr:YicC/YloC family endoribonuclease [Thermoanaerobaculia bacterium]
MNSMTGYGEAAGDNDRYRVGVTVRSVNHRFLDLRIRLPEAHHPLERLFDELLRSRLERGRVEARVTVEAAAAGARRLRVDHDLARAVVREMEGLEAAGVASGPLRLADLVRVPGVVELEGVPVEWTEADDETVLEAAGRALDQLVAARTAEGDRLSRLLADRVARLRRELAALERRAPEARRRAHEELRRRIDELLGEPGVEKGRLEQEAALLAERTDVREELDRL